MDPPHHPPCGMVIEKPKKNVANSKGGRKGNKIMVVCPSYPYTQTSGVIQTPWMFIFYSNIITENLSIYTTINGLTMMYYVYVY